MKIAEEHGPVLTGRSLAGAIAAELAQHVSDAGSVVVDFAGVQAMSPSFADELFGKLWARVDADTVVLENVDEHVASVAQMMRRNRELAPLSGPAVLALSSLRDHPHLRDASAIDRGPYSVDQVDTQGLVEGLAELERRGLAVQVVEGWRLTPAGQAAASS